MADMSNKKYTPKHCKEKKHKVRLPISAYLSYLVIATLLVGSVSLAKYTTSTTDVDGARVAKFEVSATAANSGNQADKITLSSVTLNSETYAFTVQNTSEVVVRYIVIVKNVPLDVDVSVNDSEFMLPDEDGTIIYDTNNVLGIGANKDCTITFRAHDEFTEAKEYEDKMIVKVQFDQVS